MHEIEEVSGIAKMFYVGEVPWHGLGTRLENPPTVEEAIRFAGLEWEVESVPLIMEGTDIRVPAFANVRSTDRKVLGVVGQTYRPLQNLDAFQWFQVLREPEEKFGSARCGAFHVAPNSTYRCSWSVEMSRPSPLSFTPAVVRQKITVEFQK